MKSSGFASSAESCSRSARQALARCSSTRLRNWLAVSGWFRSAWYSETSRRTASGILRCQTPEVCTRRIDAAPNHHEVLRHRLLSDPADAALKSDVRHVVLSATIWAAADLDPDFARCLDQFRLAAQLI